MSRRVSKGRDSKTYSHKLNAIKKWHAKRVAERTKWSEESLKKAKPLKPLEWYVEKLKPAGGRAEKTPKGTNTARPKRQIGGYW